MKQADSNGKLEPVSLNIRTIPRYLRQRLKVFAAEKGKSMDEVVVDLIQDAIYSDSKPKVC